ncbi:glucosamine-6-phosphate deaminase [Microbacterium sp. W4I4]|uniref:6-phosphogluconolactonase n=1 Tax=Microbacterium sp. W4I4 TaxID=3042295 RepID=UPI0027822215|nr:6-phosphogluconolactonase [Microbacterium sp. W4I4]MDQ0614464.1 glucosamine-6-phosphate deaminase [Microbacterium sp. W4I4]
MDKIPSAASRIHVATSVEIAGREAAGRAASVIRDTLATRGNARVIFASAPSQQAMLTALVEEPGIDWSLVRSFHMDEYLNLASDHPNSFGRWLEERLPVAAHAGLERIRTHGRPAAEAVRYGALISEAPIDLVCLGVGVNGHIAFNEPGTSDPDDPEIARVVTLNDASRRQQVDEKLFATLDEVPTQALTLTVPALLSGRSLVCSVIGSHKADAVARALQGPVDASSPASYLRTHPDVTWFLDDAAATGLNRETRRSDTSLQL